MTMPPSAPDLETLLAHRGWVQALARHLVADATEAEDLAQQAWERALTRPPRHGANLKAWWAALLRSLAGQAWRQQQARQGLQQRLATRPAQDPATPPEVAERLDTFQRLARAVAELPEPYGSAVYLRFFEDLPVREVARRLGVPLPTAQSRLSRGVAQLRTRMESDLGASWRQRCLVFTLPWSWSSTASLSTTTLLAMNLKTLLLCLGLLLLPLAWWLMRPTSADALPDSTVLSAADSLGPVGGASRPAPATPPQAMPSAFEREALLAAAAATHEDALLVEVRDAITLEVVPHAEIHFLPHAAVQRPEARRAWREERLDPFALSTRFGQAFQADAQGQALLPPPAAEDWWQLVAASGERFGYRWFMDGAAGAQGVEILLYPEQHIKLEVVDEAGQPLAGAVLGFEAAPAAYSSAPSLTAVSDAQGRARIPHVELQIQDHPQRAVTVALLVPSAAPQVRELAPQEIGQETVRFIMPSTGVIEVEARDAAGVALADGKAISLQLAPAPGEASAEAEFQGSLGRSVQVAYLHQGVATFPQVGLGTRLEIATYDPELGRHVSILADGPTHPGETRRVSLALASGAGSLPLHFVDGEGQSLLAGTRQAVVISHRGADGKLAGRGRELEVDAEGRAELALDDSQLRAEELWVSTQPPGWQIPSGSLRYGLRALAAGEWSAASEVELPYATTCLVQGRLVDENGQGIAGAELTWSVKELGSEEKAVLSERWELRSDADGFLRIEGPPLARDQEAHLSVRQAGQTYAEALTFGLGEESQTWVLSRPQVLTGRLLLDQPQDLARVELQWVLGDFGEPGSRMGTLAVESPNGRFTIPDELGREGSLGLALLAKGSRELLATRPQLQRLAEEQGGDGSLPDWDLRGTLRAVHLEVRDAAGAAIDGVQLRRQGADLGQALPADGTLLTASWMKPWLVSAPGYLEQEVLPQAQTEVVLKPAPTWEMALSEALPETAGVRWVVHLLPCDASGAIRLGDARRLQAPLAAKGAAFTLPRLGKWALGLQAVVADAEPAPFQGAYRFADGSPFQLLDFDRPSAWDWRLEVDADAIAAAAAEALTGD